MFQTERIRIFQLTYRGFLLTNGNVKTNTIMANRSYWTGLVGYLVDTVTAHRMKTNFHIVVLVWMFAHIVSDWAGTPGQIKYHNEQQQKLQKIKIINIIFSDSVFERRMAAISKHNRLTDEYGPGTLHIRFINDLWLLLLQHEAKIELTQHDVCLRYRELIKQWC